MDAVVSEWSERVRRAAESRAPIRIHGGDTKRFYGNRCEGEPLDVRACHGIVSYEPSELVITVRAGTPLAAIEKTLAQHKQVLAFEPPHFGAGATVGGCIAAGLAGPRRAAAGPVSGAVRDHVLGAKLLDGRGKLLQFGGTVMKNVAGYDVARALAGSLGVLGVLIEISIKVLPAPLVETTLQFEMPQSEALRKLNEWGGKPWPISASVWSEGVLRVRLSGSRAAVESARTSLGGSQEANNDYWLGLREHTLPFFLGESSLWRLSVPSIAPELEFPQPPLIEWGGALRWVRSDWPAAKIRDLTAAVGGHATLFRGDACDAGVFTPLSPAALALHQRLKAEFDPAGVFNRGRLYAEL
jgi:glycolate oxidase FAD binding subunit